MPSTSPELLELAGSLKPDRTVLLLGAGSSLSSGGPLSIDLCRLLEAEFCSGVQTSDDLAELASILELRHPRLAIVQVLQKRLVPLSPDASLRSLVKFGWPTIYTTNYDQLVEKACAAERVDLGVVRSHFDWEEAHPPGRPVLYKIHGCISQDRSLNHRSSMILSVEDYDRFASYRELLFDRLKIELAGNAAVVVGQSLRDRHLQALLADALRLQREAYAPGRIHLLLHEDDPDRASVWRQRGVYSVTKGDLPDFVAALESAHSPSRRSPIAVVGGPSLPAALAASVRVLDPPFTNANAVRLFFGSPATYGDVVAGLTFSRDAERYSSEPVGVATIITGVAGVGKSTLARRLMLQWSRSLGLPAFEHREELPLLAEPWISYEASLKQSGQRALLLVDNCIPYQRQLNQLVEGLPSSPALHIVVTAETASWRARQKSPRLFSDATHHQLTRLSANELRDLRDLVVGAENLRSLVDASFLSKNPQEQLRYLERKCGADMFVCLKAIFSVDSLDEIILREYKEIPEPAQGVYRYTAAIEAAGGLPHRQMILRLTSLDPTLISSSLHLLEGLVEEATEDSSQGIYLWRTRHPVIATLLSRYKFSDPAEMVQLLFAVISGSNPSYHEETRTLREICNSDRGIRAVPDPSERIRLYRTMAEVMPRDNVVRHRLVSELIRLNNLPEAEGELERAIKDVGLDPALQRYKARLLIARSRQSALLLEDKKAMLRGALAEAEVALAKYPDNKYCYFMAADVAEAWRQLTGEVNLVYWARQKLEKAQEVLLDPQIGERLRELWRD